MIFTTRALQIEVQPAQEPFDEIINHILTDKSPNAYKRKQFFIRYIGTAENEEGFKQKLSRLVQAIKEKGPVLYLTGIAYSMGYEETGQYIQIYEACKNMKDASAKELFELAFPMKFQNDMLELTQKTAFFKVLQTYELAAANANDSMKKNFAVKLLGWIGHYLPLLYGQEEMILPKVIFAGAIKRQELLFLYYLSLMGCDVLYLNPQEDIIQDYPECQQFSILHEERTKAAFKMPSQEEVLSGTTMTLATGQTASQSGGVQLGQVQQAKGHTGIQLGQRQAMEQSPTDEELRHSLQGRNRSSNNTLNHSTIGRGSIDLVRIKQKQAQSQPIQRQPVQSSKKVSQNAVSYQAKSTPSISLQRSPNMGNPSQSRCELSYEELAQLSSSVVMIAIKDQQGKMLGSGSGVVIHPDGYILTNYHVVRGGSVFGVKFENEDSIYETHRIVKYHPDYDLAIIKVEKVCRALPVYEGIPVVRGQKVVAIGSPLGLFNSVSDGIISAFREFEFTRMIQFTAPISHGSSGGALLNMYGELIGISTGGFDDGQNLNVAIDYDTIRRFAGNYV